MLTKKQQELADLLISTKTHAKVRRRKINPDGSIEFYYFYRDTSPIDFRVSDEEFAFVHHEKNPASPLSPVIVNLRNLPEKLVEKIAEILSKVKLKEKPDFCTGIPNTGTPIASKYSKLLRIPVIKIFEKEDNPSKPRILQASDAPESKGEKILLIDDLITKGESKLRAIKVAEDLGFKVVGLLVLVDREQGGKKVLEEEGYKLFAPLKLTSLLDYYLEKKKITKSQYDQTISYLKNDV